MDKIPSAKQTFMDSVNESIKNLSQNDVDNVVERINSAKNSECTFVNTEIIPIALELMLIKQGYNVINKNQQYTCISWDNAEFIESIINNK